MKTIILLILLTATATFAQSEGQSFCYGDSKETYFTLQTEKKILLWYSTYYTETLIGEEVIEGNNYKVYVQEWKDTNKDTLYLREEGSRILGYYKKIKKEKLRYDSSFKPNKQWEGREVTYTILSHEAELKTPVCHYKNLMALKAEYPTITFIFYYLKGFGYVGATQNDELVSFAIPKMP